MLLSSLLANSASNNANSGGNVPVDVYNKVSKIMQAQNTAAPKLNAALSADKTTLSALGQLQSALASFQKVAQSFTGAGLSATSSAQGVLTATASDSSLAGTYAIQVAQLAQSQVLRSQSLASPDTAIGGGAAGRISFEFGNASGSVFSAGAAGKTVDIPSGGDTLQGIAAAINGANIGVNAKVVPSGGGYALEFTSPSGSAGSMRIGVSNNPTLKDFLGFDPAGAKNLSQTASAQNAKLTVNGVALESPSNTVTGAVLGATMKLTATGAGNLVVAQGSAQLFQNVTNLVNTYNSLNAKLNALRQGDLKADGAALQTQNQLARIFGTAGGSAVGITSQTLAKIGIGVQKNGDLAIDATKLKNAVDADPAGISHLFSHGGSGIAENLANKIQSMVGPSGSLPKKATAINQDIAALSAKKDSLEKALTKQANALAKYYSQQNSTGATTSSASPSNGNTSLFNLLF